MSAPKAKPIYTVTGDDKDAHVVDSLGIAVVERITLGLPYVPKLGDSIMQIIADALNAQAGKESE